MQKPVTPFPIQKSNKGSSLGPLEGGYSSRIVILLLVIATEAFRALIMDDLDMEKYSVSS